MMNIIQKATSGAEATILRWGVETLYFKNASTVLMHELTRLIHFKTFNF